VSNNGDGSHDPRTDASGFYWPGGIHSRLPAIFNDGLVWGGIVQGQVRFNGNTHRQGLQAGKILTDHSADDPAKEKYRVYKIRKNWESLSPGPEREEYEKDYNEWPAEDGAPWIDVNKDGIFTRGIDKPEHVGDETLWYVSNDLDIKRSHFTYGSDPIGLEFQVTVFGFEKTNFLGDVVFKKYKVINKSRDTVKQMYFGYWSDPDLGDANDDYVGCDTTLDMAYTYNGDEDDWSYGSPPPAHGYTLLQGPIVESEGNLAYTNNKILQNHINTKLIGYLIIIEHSVYRDAQQRIYEGSVEFYNNLRGFGWNGEPFIDPITGDSTKTTLAGDPVGGTGWYEGDGWQGGPAPADRRMVFSTGPFNFAPGDTQEVIIALHMDRGTDRLNSITKIRNQSKLLHKFHHNFFEDLVTIPPPNISKNEGDGSVTIYWDESVESFNKADPELALDGIADSIYKFEGYRIWQFEDSLGSNPKLIYITDIENDLSNVRDYKYVAGRREFTTIFDSPNTGLKRYLKITNDAYTNLPLKNEHEYYFGVTAYAYSDSSSQKLLESEPNIIKVVPHKNPIDNVYPEFDDDIILGEHIEGIGDGFVAAKIIDPNLLDGNEFEINILGTEDTSFYSITNLTTGDIVLDSADHYGFDTTYNPVINGVVFSVINTGRDSIQQSWKRYRINKIIEIAGPDGIEIEEPINALKNYNSTGEWKIKTVGDGFVWQRVPSEQGLGYTDYEIRFTKTGSQYFIASTLPGFTVVYFSNPIGLGTVPIEVWDLGNDLVSDTDNVRLTVKILDKYGSGDSSRAIQDSMWTHLPNGDWESIFVYESDFDNDNLPPNSGRSEAVDHRFGNFVISGELPEEGTIIRIESWKPLSGKDKFTLKLPEADFNNLNSARERINEITVYPNPFMDSNHFYPNGKRHVVFGNLPDEIIIRIFNIGGTFVKRLEKNNRDRNLYWDLTNQNGEQVSSGIYIAYLDMPGVGSKILKVGVVF
ncbi:MAG: hypothetical protein K9J16_18660, partial [Melioribacteraceae bacterium]|nr:hypothetical protein [Melioribacteraceae bacterium]MCF8356964.1 hypothetical protein [Melioribacteraceae bacterium]MCF8396319.1 hypothetical protein [Melioribacteraceae bacterium]MCF8421246.1 hypothetical protein [Melioribacteraceae bacterium]